MQLIVMCKFKSLYDHKVTFYYFQHQPQSIDDIGGLHVLCKLKTIIQQPNFDTSEPSSSSADEITETCELRHIIKPDYSEISSSQSSTSHESIECSDVGGTTDKVILTVS